MSELREMTRERRLRIDAGERFDIETVATWCCSLSEALHVFSDAPEEVDEDIFPRCCGERCETSGGFFGGRSECKKCGAKIVDALSPMCSPILERGNSYVTLPGEKLVELLGERHWLAMHEGDRPA